MLQAMSDTMGWKRAKGKKKGKALQPDLSRIYGYINDADENDADMASNTIQVSCHLFRALAQGDRLSMQMSRLLPRSSSTTGLGHY